MDTRPVFCGVFDRGFSRFPCISRHRGVFGRPPMTNGTTGVRFPLTPASSVEFVGPNWPRYGVSVRFDNWSVVVAMRIAGVRDECGLSGVWYGWTSGGVAHRLPQLPRTPHGVLGFGHSGCFL